METVLNLLIVTAISGVVGTGIGGVIGALFRKSDSHIVSLLLSFAAGVMTAIVCFDLIPQAFFPKDSTVSIFLVIAGILVGIGVIYLLNWLIDRKTVPENPHVDANHPKTHDTPAELIHQDHYEIHKDTGKSLFLAGVVMACAIALHNVPEGMTIGAAAAIENSALTGSSLILAILIGLHNIPEGMAVSVPLISGGMRCSKAILVTALSGFPTVLGALLGYAIGDIGAVGLSLSLSFASGAMLYVVFGEILPEAILMYRSKLPAFFIMLGLLTGLLIIYI